MLKRRLLNLLGKLLRQTDGLHSTYGESLMYAPDYQRRLSVIHKMLVQQKQLFDSEKNICDRIVNIDRDYVRPIVREKGIKSVEFVSKVNNIQLDGIFFIEHLSFNAFIEGIRLEKCINLQQRLTGTKVTAVAADSIYVNNTNRSHLLCLQGTCGKG